MFLQLFLAFVAVTAGTEMDARAGSIPDFVERGRRHVSFLRKELIGRCKDQATLDRTKAAAKRAEKSAAAKSKRKIRCWERLTAKVLGRRRMTHEICEGFSPPGRNEKVPVKDVWHLDRDGILIVKDRRRSLDGPIWEGCCLCHCYACICRKPIVMCTSRPCTELYCPNCRVCTKLRDLVQTRLEVALEGDNREEFPAPQIVEQLVDQLLAELPNNPDTCDMCRKPIKISPPTSGEDGESDATVEQLVADQIPDELPNSPVCEYTCEIPSNPPTSEGDGKLGSTTRVLTVPNRPWNSGCTGAGRGFAEVVARHLRDEQDGVLGRELVGYIRIDSVSNRFHTGCTVHAIV